MSMSSSVPKVTLPISTLAYQDPASLLAELAETSGMGSSGKER